MKNNSIKNLGEVKLIKIIEQKILESTGKALIRDDTFFFKLLKENNQKTIVFNTDMFVSTTDAPEQMSYYQMGRKAVLMNLSDLIVKGVEPKGIFISLGLPEDMELSAFIELLEGMIDYCKKWNLDYLGGDFNKTNEIIINPTVFGFSDPLNILYRKGIQTGDFLVANSKFGLTGVGFNILLNKKGNLDKFTAYKRAINSVLKPQDVGLEGPRLAEKNLATSSIDSSDGLAKSLRDLMISNRNIGFKIEFNKNLIDHEAIKYSKEYEVPLEEIVFEGGEEFIHLFTIKPDNFELVQSTIKESGGKIFKIGEAISEEKIFIIKKSKLIELKSKGYEHFN